MLFSIVVPVYKVEKYIEKCIKSIQAQTYEDYELILIDDGSTDGSGKICDDYAGKDGRIIVIHKENGGVVSARNAGLSVAKGKYILFVDADDWIAENTLQELADIVEKYHEPDTILFDSYSVYTDRKELIMQWLEPGYYDKERLNRDIIPVMMYDKKRPFLSVMIIGALWSKAIKKEIVRDYYCNEKDLYKGEDYACTFEYIYCSQSLYYLKKPMYFYNKMNEESVMTTYDTTFFRNHDKVVQYLQNHLGVYSQELLMQINAYNVNGICIGVFHEMRHGRRLWEARNHIKKELEETSCLKSAVCDGLPLHAKVYIALLKHKLYLLTLLLAKVYLLMIG